MTERAAGSTSDDAGEVSASGVLRVTATRPAARGEQGSGGEPLLVLTSGAGEVFHLPVDGSLRAAVRAATAPVEPSPTGGPTPLRPKDIQARIRGGESAAEVAEAAGVGVEAVERYAGPVLAERSHVATVARATLVRSARSRPSLEDLVRHRLASRGVVLATVAWDAWRRGESGWVLQVGFRAGTRDRVAQWRFDPVAELVDPLDDEARWLSASHEAESASAGASSRRLSSVRVFDVEDEGGLEGGTGSLPAVGPDPGAPSRGGGADPGPGAAQEPWEGPDHDEVAARTMDLLDALSDRRGRRQPMVDLEDELDLDDDGADEVDQITEAPSPDAEGGVGPGYGSGFPAHLRPGPGRTGRGATHLRAVGPSQGHDADEEPPATDAPDLSGPAGPAGPTRQDDPEEPAADRPTPPSEDPGTSGPPSGAEPTAPGPVPGLQRPEPVPTAPVPTAGERRQDRGAPSSPARASAGPAADDVPATGSIGRWVGPASPTALPATTTATGPLAPRSPAAPAEVGQAPAAADETDAASTPEQPAKAPRGGTRSRGGRRSSVPSWDEIVFGSAPEDPKG